MHKDLLDAKDMCIGGEFYEFDYASNKTVENIAGFVGVSHNTIRRYPSSNAKGFLKRETGEIASVDAHDLLRTQFRRDVIKENISGKGVCCKFIDHKERLTPLTRKEWTASRQTALS